MSLSEFASNLFRPAFDAGAYGEALEFSDAKYVAKMLKHYPDVANWVSPKGRSALNIAVGNGSKDVSRMLIDAGANIERMDPERNMQPLNAALHRKSPEIAEMLIDKGADVNARDGNGRGSGNNAGQTPLYMAVSECPVAILKKLVAKGAQVNVYCDDNTPLTLAAMADNQDDNIENIKYLVSAGADIGMAKPSNGVTADQLAQKSETEQYLRQLKQASDIQVAAIAKAKADMDAVRAGAQQELKEKADAAEAIECLTQGTKIPMKALRPLRLKAGGI